ncbi:hypothetical protein AB205_0055340 [Aquarana catesbeiana]|uniref:Uncharacterized protein n=1 Tax=Aquarana catesbeiana TaxID=8400 RepID=A0A2G9RCA2_AQUCT|nr:hypothetical protein AB205_0055340 [Aquarana catesbeiana]
MDRIHRSLEQLMEAALNKDSLMFQGHRYQVFQDLSQLTLTKRKAMKPHLLILQHHRIAYRWSFPFAIHFSHKGTSYTCKSAEDLITILQDIPLPGNT